MSRKKKPTKVQQARSRPGFSASHESTLNSPRLPDATESVGASPADQLTDRSPISAENGQLETPSVNFPAEARSELVKYIATGLLAAMLSLFGWSATVFYNMKPVMHATFEVYQEKVENRRKTAQLLADYVQNTAGPVFQRSADRTLQVRDLDWRRQSTPDQNAADGWHTISGMARLEGAADSGKITEVSSTMVPAAAALTANLNELLSKETAVWRRVDAYVDAQAKNAEGKEDAYGALLTALLDYQRILSAHGPTLMIAAEEGFSAAQEQLTKEQEAFTKTMNEHREQLNLAAAGTVVSSLSIVGIGLFLCWPLLRHRPRVGPTPHQ